MISKTDRNIYYILYILLYMKLNIIQLRSLVSLNKFIFELDGVPTFEFVVLNYILFFIDYLILN